MNKSILLKKVKLWSMSALGCISLLSGYSSFNSSALKNDQPVNTEISQKSNTKESEQKSENEKKSESVYITKSGKCYHRNGCKHLRKSKIAIDKTEAQKNFKPCKHCNPK